MSHTASHNPNLFQWKRFSKKKATRDKPEIKSSESDIETWLKKVEQATENAVKKTFSDSSHAYQPGKRSYGSDIRETVDQLHDEDDAHTEAQELVTSWMNEKLRFDFLDNDDETDCHQIAPQASGGVQVQIQQTPRDILQQDKNAEQTKKIPHYSNQLTSGVESAAHEKWYEDSEVFIQNYLKSNGISSTERTQDLHGKSVKENDVLGTIDLYEADENTVVQALMKNMMEKPVIKRSVMKNMQLDRDNSKHKGNKHRDPRTTMEMRHKEVKEARKRRQKEEEKRREERLIMKEAKFKAQQIMQQEEARKMLRIKQEEEAIQMEMNKIRKEMIEQRKREEAMQKSQNKEDVEQVFLREEEKKIKRRQEMDKSEREKQKEKILSEISRLEEKETRIAEIMKRRNMENRNLMHRCFSSWCRVVLSQRVKIGKAKAMSDWKCMQRAWIAWKTYTRNHRLDEETRSHQAKVRDTKRKEKIAMDSAKLRLLRRAFFTWKVWLKAEQERKEILKQQETTKSKMKALLDAVASGNLGPKGENRPSITLQSLDSNDAVEDLPHFKQEKSRSASKIRRENDNHTRKPGKPRAAWQVTKQDVKRLNPNQMRHLADNHVDSTSSSKPAAFHPYESRHKFQKEVIDQQRLLLQEQKKMIQDMQEQQRMLALQQEIASLQQQQGHNQKHMNHKSTPVAPSVTSNTMTSLREESQIVLSARSTKPEKNTLKKHPIVSKMEERAAERMRKRKELEEMKRKREEEKLRNLQEEEERKQREEEEQKRREIEARREARRLKKKQEEEKTAEQQRMRQLNIMAEDHYRKTLIKNYGILPWKELMLAVEKRSEVAIYHFNNKLMKATILAWKTRTENQRKERELKADGLYRVILLRRGLRSWMKYGERMSILEQKATMHHNKILKKKYLKNWVDYTTDEKLSQWDKEAKADSHNRTRLLRRVFNVIRSYRTLVLREEERRHRLQDLRRKVTQMLPDFQYSSTSIADDVTEEKSD